MSLSPELTLALVAIYISLVATIAACMQLDYQYRASAVGYPQCTERIMGGWARTKTRRFLWDEMRYEVQYDTPVIFISPPDNKKGPIWTQPIYFLTGTKQSLDDTWTTEEMDPRCGQLAPKRIAHTSDIGRVSWLTLLYAVQNMEDTSRKWQQERYSEAPPGALTARYGIPQSAPTLEENHTMTVALQRSRRSWDTMPKAMAKPYATSTLCHMIELLAMLGIYWKEFDRKSDRYWAEGNGFLVLGERVSDLSSIVFSLHVHGRNTFGRMRVIPNDLVKELTFGYIPTVYRETIDQSRVQVLSDIPENLSSLQLSSDREIAESLTVIGCNNNTVNYFLEEGKRTSHIFPLAFEILGMMCQNLHIENSSFTYIPNPTASPFDKRQLNLRELMRAFQSHFEAEFLTSRNHVIVNTIRHHVHDVLQFYEEKDVAQRLVFLQVLHRAIDDADEILTARQKQHTERRLDSDKNRNQSVPTWRVEHDGAGETLWQSVRREKVQDVLRLHIQEVLRLLNEHDERHDAVQIRTVETVGGATFRPQPQPQQQPPQSFECVDDASPDERPRRFMEVYFEAVRRCVMPRAEMSTSRRAGNVSVHPHSAPPSIQGDCDLSLTPIASPRPRSSRNVSPSVAAHAAGQAGAVAGARGAMTVALAGNNSNNNTTLITGGSGGRETELQSMTTAGEIAGSDDASEVVVDNDEVENGDDDGYCGRRMAMPLSAQNASHDDIWCTLVFRMICWLMLHDINKLDMQLPKSELLGSRVPVYIA